MKTREKIGGILFDVFSYTFFGLFVLSILYIFWNTFVMSISPEVENTSLAIRIWPSTLDFSSYHEIWVANKLSGAFFITVYITLLGTLLHVLLCSMAGYALSRPGLPYKNFILGMILLSMIIPGQMIMVPLFVVYKNLGLINQIQALIFSGLVSGFAIIVMRNFFLETPYTIAEAAKIDGAGEWRIFLRIFLPISLPGLATITLFQIVAKWNTFFDGVLFINDAAKQPLQVVLRSIVAALTNPTPTGSTGAASMYGKNMQSAAIIISILPLLIAYPYMQRYFVKGMMVGSIKD